MVHELITCLAAYRELIEDTEYRFADARHHRTVTMLVLCKLSEWLDRSILARARF